MASLASRYAMLCRQMRPFTSALYKLIGGYGGSHARQRVLSPLAKVDVIMWRAFLCLLHFEESSYARPLASFLDRAPSVLFEYDASLTGFGAGVSIFNPQTRRWEIAAYTSLAMPYLVDERDSGFQNSNEFMGILLCMLLVKQTGCVEPGFSFNVIGDNTTSLSWCAHDRVCSERARRANIGYTLLAVDLDASVSEVRHIAGADNIIYDGLSRGKNGAEVGLPADKEIKLTPESLAYRYLVMCNPTVPLATLSEHNDLAVALLALLATTEPNSSTHL
jgi:hypothetical protein